MLYWNLGNWKCEDSNAQAGVACAGQHSTGEVPADIDGDGDLDLLVNCIGGPNVLPPLNSVIGDSWNSSLLQGHQERVLS